MNVSTEFDFKRERPSSLVIKKFLLLKNVLIHFCFNTYVVIFYNKIIDLLNYNFYSEVKQVPNDASTGCEEGFIRFRKKEIKNLAPILLSKCL